MPSRRARLARRLNLLLPNFRMSPTKWAVRRAGACDGGLDAG